MSLTGRLAVLEEDILGEVQKGTLLARIKACEIHSLGGEGEGPPLTRVAALELAMGFTPQEDTKFFHNVPSDTVELTSDIMSIDVVAAVKDVAGAATDAVLALAERMPLFGPFVTLLTRLKAAADQAKENSTNCKQVGLWAAAIKTALVMAAPVLHEVDATGIIGELLCQIATDVKSLLDTVLAYAPTQARDFCSEW
jgi:hypothetical protein